MKIVLLDISPSYAEEHKRDRMIKYLQKLGHEVLYYDPMKDPREAYKFNTKHFQMYEGVLNYAEEVKADLLFDMDYLASPEFLLAELKVRPYYKPKVAFQMQFREAHKSLARANTLKELLDMKQVHHTVITNLGVKNVIYPKYVLETGVNLSKIHMINEPYYLMPELYQKTTREEAKFKYNINRDTFTILFNGRMLWSRGADLFTEALKYIDEDILLLFHPNFIGADLSPIIVDQVIANHKRTALIQDWLDNEEEAVTIMASDLLVCPHRRIYEYSSTALPPLAMCVKIPLVVPDFYYLNRLVEEFKIGVTYEPENPQAMAKAINYTKKNYAKIVKEAKFDEGLKNFEDPVPLYSEAVIAGF